MGDLQRHSDDDNWGGFHTKSDDYRDYGAPTAPETTSAPLTDQEVRDLARVIKNSIAVANTAIEKLQKDPSVTIDLGCDRTPDGQGRQRLHLSVLITRPEVL